jgi:predicted amidohydrolase YtcJ
MTLSLMTRWRPVLALTAVLACRGAPQASADIVVFGRVWTGDSTAPWAAAVALAGDTVAAVGDSADIARLVGPGTRVLANGKAMVVPGFMDGHLHFLSGGYQLTSVDLRDASSPAEFVARLRDYAARLQPGEWITGGGWDHERWPGAPLPEHGWIDSVTPRNPVFINRLDGHMALANAVALRLAGVSRATPDIAGGMIVRDRNREPTGIFKDAAQQLILGRETTPGPERDDSDLVRAMAWAASRGVTAVATLSNGVGARSTWAEYASLKRLRRAGRLTVRVTLYPEIWDWRGVADTIRADPGDDWIQVNGIKGYVDGSLGSTTAWFYQPYDDAPATSGLLTTPEDSLRTWIGAADSAGLQVAVHAIGDRANGLILDIYDSLARVHPPRDRRFRIEHAQHLRSGDIERIARSGVVASMQPYHAIDDGRWAEKRIGPARIRSMYAFRSLLDYGAHLAFGSDWTVAPMDPLLGIYAAVTRRTLDGKHPEGWVPEQKITVEEALRAYTTGNAYAIFAEARRGKLVPGYLADVVLLDQDLTAIPPGAIERARVRATIVGGRVVFENRRLRAASGAGSGTPRLPGLRSGYARSGQGPVGAGASEGHRRSLGARAAAHAGGAKSVKFDDLEGVLAEVKMVGWRD